MAAQLLPAAEIHWSFPCGNPLSLRGWNGNTRLRTIHHRRDLLLARRLARLAARGRLEYRDLVALRFVVRLGIGRIGALNDIALDAALPV